MNGSSRPWDMKNDRKNLVWKDERIETMLLMMAIANYCKNVLPLLKKSWEWPFFFCDQWGRRLECWPNTAASLADWMRRVTRQVWFYPWWTGRTACLFRTVPVDLTGHAQLRADGISSCCYIVNVHNHPSWATSHKEGMAWYSSRPMPSLCLWLWWENRVRKTLRIKQGPIGPDSVFCVYNHQRYVQRDTFRQLKK